MLIGRTMLTRRTILVGAPTAGALIRARSIFAKASQPATAVNFAVPPNACDSHTHIYGDATGEQRRHGPGPGGGVPALRGGLDGRHGSQCGGHFSELAQSPLKVRRRFLSFRGSS